MRSRRRLRWSVLARLPEAATRTALEDTTTACPGPSKIAPSNISFHGFSKKVREISRGQERMVGLDDRPRPDQSHDEIAEHQTGQQRVSHLHKSPHRFARAVRADFLDQHRHESRPRHKAARGCRGCVSRSKDRNRGQRSARSAATAMRIFFSQANQAEHQDDHCDSEWRILRVHEHVAVEGRTQRQKQ